MPPRARGRSPLHEPTRMIMDPRTMNAIRQNTIRDDDAPLTPVYAAPIDHPGAWKVADFKTPENYTTELDATQLRDIERAMQQIKAAGLGLDDLRREHFEVPSLRPVIDEIRHQIEDGRGFVVVRRLPVEDYSKDEIGVIFWGIGTYPGAGCRRACSATGSATSRISAARIRWRVPTATSRSSLRTPIPATWSGWRVCATQSSAACRG